MGSYAYINSLGGLKLREGPGGEGVFKSKGLIDNGTEGEVISKSQDGQWLNVKLADGREGWWAAQYVTLYSDDGQPMTSPNISDVPGEILLDVPYHSQLDLDASAAFADCGPASLRMIIGWNAVRKAQPDPHLDVNEVTHVVGIGKHELASFNQLMTAAQHFHVPMNYVRPAMLPRMERELHAGRPMLVLLHYGSIPKREHVDFNGGHFVVLVGCNGGEFMINDPYWDGKRRLEGKAFRVPRAAFETAVGPIGAQKAGNMPYQALFLDANRL
jgi:peptidase C39-like protein